MFAASRFGYRFLCGTWCRLLEEFVLGYTTTVAARPHERQNVEAMHLEYFRTQDQDLCRRIVEAHQHLAIALGRRMSRRLAEREDVTQVAMLGLLKAVNRFDPTRGVGFTTFAWRTIEGEVKRYFRDSSWSIHVPRSLQERSIAVASIVESLTQELGTSPSASQVAQQLALTDEEVIEVFELQRAARPISIDASESDEEATAIQLGEEEAGLAGPKTVVRSVSYFEFFPNVSAGL